MKQEVFKLKDIKPVDEFNNPHPLTYWLGDSYRCRVEVTVSGIGEFLYEFWLSSKISYFQIEKKVFRFTTRNLQLTLFDNIRKFIYILADSLIERYDWEASDILSYCNITDYFLVAQSFKMLERYWKENGEDSYDFSPEYEEDDEYYESDDEEYDPTYELEGESFKLSIEEYILSMKSLTQKLENMIDEKQ